MRLQKDGNDDNILMVLTYLSISINSKIVFYDLLIKAIIIIIIITGCAYFAESAGDHTTRRTTAHDNEVVLPVWQRPTQRTAAWVFDVTLRPDENFQQAHEQHERRPTTRTGQSGTRLGHRTITTATHSSSR